MKRAELFARLSELHEQTAAVCAELARVEEHDERMATPAGYVDQTTSPLGKRAHLAACRAGLPHRAIGKKRIARLEDVERWMVANDKPRRRKPTLTAGIDLAAVFDAPEAAQ